MCGQSINQPNSNPGTHSPSTYFPILLFYLIAYVAVLFINSDVDKFYEHYQLKIRFATLYFWVALFSAPPQAYTYQWRIYKVTSLGYDDFQTKKKNLEIVKNCPNRAFFYNFTILTICDVWEFEFKWKLKSPLLQRIQS